MMARRIVEEARVAAEIAERLARREEPSWRAAEPLHRVAEAFRRSVSADVELAEAGEGGPSRWSLRAPILRWYGGGRPGWHRPGDGRDERDQQRAGGADALANRPSRCQLGSEGFPWPRS